MGLDQEKFFKIAGGQTRRESMRVLIIEENSIALEMAISAVKKFPQHKFYFAMLGKPALDIPNDMDSIIMYPSAIAKADPLKWIEVLRHMLAQ